MNKQEIKATEPLTPKEIKAIQLSLGQLIEDLTETSTNPTMPWNPESRKAFKEILDAAKSAAEKIKAISGISSNLPPYISGELKNYITKES